MSCPANETHNPCGDSCEPKCADLYEYERRVDERFAPRDFESWPTTLHQK
ncbi:hypothetical protein ANCCEY_06768 [Ancylostoma ceylanicum]|uniref:Uncharacterized protein n=1 Tax=Ancylostoma ceylanicum TaxID=53326 RepID=A0A0D6LQI0_9BILA|nr:hypothetical protein ANCCEY_06768 [Ancylostoma ceylanicum]